MKAERVELVEWNSCITSATPGEITVEAKGLDMVSADTKSGLVQGGTYDRKVISAISVMFMFFRDAGQFNGFSGSSGPSKSTILGSIGHDSFSSVVACASISLSACSEILPFCESSAIASFVDSLMVKGCWRTDSGNLRSRKKCHPSHDGKFLKKDE